MLNTTKLTIGASLLGAAMACTAAPNAARGDQAQQISKPTGSAVANDKRPINERFRNLDEYLAWLEKTQGPVDGAWYRKIGPNLYELQTGNLRILGEDGTEKKTFTYQELARKFGFEK